MSYIVYDLEDGVSYSLEIGNDQFIVMSKSSCKIKNSVDYFPKEEKHV